MHILSRKFSLKHRFFKRKPATNDKKSFEETSLATLDDPVNQTTIKGIDLFNDSIQKPMVSPLEVLFRPHFSESQREQTIGASDPSILQPSDADMNCPISLDSIAYDQRSVHSISSNFSGRRVGIYIPSRNTDQDIPLKENSDEALIISQNGAFRIEESDIERQASDEEY